MYRYQENRGGTEIPIWGGEGRGVLGNKKGGVSRYQERVFYRDHKESVPGSAPQNTVFTFQPSLQRKNKRKNEQKRIGENSNFPRQNSARTFSVALCRSRDFLRL